MYALAICGSPRKEGNTELLLKEVLTELKDAGWETEIAKVGLAKPLRPILKAIQKVRLVTTSDCQVK